MFCKSYIKISRFFLPGNRSFIVQKRHLLTKVSSLNYISSRLNQLPVYAPPRFRKVTAMLYFKTC
jgi:hypothetical protein